MTVYAIGSLEWFGPIPKVQRLVTERAIFAPIWQLGFINGTGPRVGVSGFGLIPGYPYTAPYEDITIRGT
jgi:peptide/nickel transport system substrate-binding protein